MKCNNCSSELLLDHVKQRDDITEYWYTCINPKCSKKGVAFRPNGAEADAKIKPAK